MLVDGIDSSLLTDAILAIEKSVQNTSTKGPSTCNLQLLKYLILRKRQYFYHGRLNDETCKFPSFGWNEVIYEYKLGNRNSIVLDECRYFVVSRCTDEMKSVNLIVCPTIYITIQVCTFSSNRLRKWVLD